MEQTLQTPLEEVKAIEILIPYLSHNNEKNVKSYAVQALNSLCYLNEGRLLIGIKKGMIPLLINLISNGTANLKEFAYNIILKVAPYIAKMESIDMNHKIEILDQVMPVYLAGLGEPSFASLAFNSIQKSLEIYGERNNPLLSDKNSIIRIGSFLKHLQRMEDPTVSNTMKDLLCSNKSVTLCNVYIFIFIL